MLDTFTLFHMTSTIDFIQRHALNGLLLEKNSELLAALKNRIPIDEIRLLQSEIQELYNHAEAYKLTQSVENHSFD